MKNKINIICYILLLLGCISCKKQLALSPYDGLQNKATFATLEGMKAATIGNYSFLKRAEYSRNYHFLSEYSSDNVSLSGTTTDPLFYLYNYQHQVNQSNVADFWKASYQCIYACNNVLAHIPTEKLDDEYKQIKAENLFLRAMLHFNLVNVFGRPFTENNGKSLGVMIRKDNDVNALPARATVAEVYQLIIADLKQSKILMTMDKNNNFASKAAAQALLSRVYLYKGDYQNAYLEADSVIKSNKFGLIATNDLPNYFKSKPESNKETIFAIKYELKDNLSDVSIGSLYFTAGIGYGEMYASKTLRDLFAQHKEDLRDRFILPVYSTNSDGSIKKDPSGNPILETRNGFPKYYITKYSYQDGYETLSSPVYLRLAEMYLNRAEAAFHLGIIPQTISDLNILRTRAGISKLGLYTATNLQNHSNWLDVILDERRLELCFEGQRKFDVFRNQKDLVRNYPGTHLISGQNSQTIKYTDPRVVVFIPETEITLNPKLIQNP